MPANNHVQALQTLYSERLISAIAWNIFVQSILTFLFIFILNADLLDPCSWVFSVITNIFTLKSFYSLISVTLITTFQGIFFGKKYMKAPPKYFKRILVVLNLFSIENLMICSLYALTGWLSVRLYSSLSDNSNEISKPCLNYELSQCLREENVFIQIAGVWVGLYFFLKKNIFGTTMVQFPHIHQDKVLNVKTAANNIIIHSVKKSLYLVIYFCLFYILFGGRLRNMISDVFSLFLEDYPLDSFINLFTSKVIVNMFIYFALFCISMYMFDFTFNIVLTEPLNLPIENNTKLTLNMALIEEAPQYITLLACQELRTIAVIDKTRRRELFTLSQPGGHPHNWRNILVHCYKRLDNFNKELEEIINVKCEEPLVNGYTHKIDYNKLPPKIRSMMTSPIAHETLQKTRKHSEHRLDDRLQSHLNSVIQNICEKPGIHYFFGEITHWKIKYLFRHSQPVIWTSESLAFLSAASLHEDRYGIVQNDLPQIISRLIQTKQNLDKLNKSGLFIRKHEFNDGYCNRMKTALNSAIKRSIYKIVATFSKHINDIGLSSDVLNAIQPFVHFKEA